MHRVVSCWVLVAGDWCLRPGRRPVGAAEQDRTNHNILTHVRSLLSTHDVVSQCHDESASVMALTASCDVAGCDQDMADCSVTLHEYWSMALGDCIMASADFSMALVDFIMTLVDCSMALADCIMVLADCAIMPLADCSMACDHDNG
jgi:hypothetical protein